MVSSQTIKSAQQGNEMAIQEIFSKFKNIIQMRTKNYFFYGGDREDVIQEAMIGLLKAINGYDENKTASFTTFAILCIKRQIITAIKSSNAGKNRILNMAMINPETEDTSNISYSNKSFNFYNPEEIVMGKERFRELNRYLKTNLSKMENEVFEYMLAEMTYTEIAEKIGRTPKSIDNSIQRIKKKLNKFLEEYDKE